jgi:RNA 3'-terminal phosphate cyclase (ATP)
MDGELGRLHGEVHRRDRPAEPSRRKRWTTHAAHEAIPPPVRVSWDRSGQNDHGEPGGTPAVSASAPRSNPLITLDGSRGEGGGQILRTALSLSLLSGKPFRMIKVRANRDKPGLRPQHLKAVEAAAALGQAEVKGGAVGSRELVFRPGTYTPHDLAIDIGTAGSTSLVLQTLHLPIAMRAESAVRVVLTGGTFNPKAPPFSFLDQTWRAYLAAFGMPLGLAMPTAGFYPRGGGQLDAWIEPGTPRAWILTDPGPLKRIRGVAGVANLRDDIAERLRDRAMQRLAEQGLDADLEIELARWPSPGQGAALSLTAHHEHAIPATFAGLGERGKPAEEVADEAVEQLLAHEQSPGAVDPHSADQILLPLALAEGRSIYTVSEITEHLRTNADTIRAFLDRRIVIEEADDEGRPGRVVIG